jgi:hypothetical protein
MILALLRPFTVCMAQNAKMVPSILLYGQSTKTGSARDLEGGQGGATGTEGTQNWRTYKE